MIWLSPNLSEDSLYVVVEQVKNEILNPAEDNENNDLETSVYI